MTYHSHDDNFIYIRASQQEAAKLDAVYLPTIRVYKLPLNKNTLKDIMFYINHQKLTELYHKEVMEEASIKMMKTLNPAMQTAGKLREYQAQDATLIRKYPVLAIFNEQRTGKTPTVLHALKDLTNGLIVCPSSLKLNWLREFEEWSDTKAVVVSGSKKKRMRIYAQLAEETMIISYETLRADINDILRMFKRFNYLVVDEAHRLRNHKTKQSMAVFKVRNLCDRVYPMTGTPAVNHAANVYGIMKLLYPTKYASYWAFVERYFKVVDGMFGKDIYGLKEERAQEFNNLLHMHSLQRKRREVMSCIPIITERIV